MNRSPMSPAAVFTEIGKVEWSYDRDAFVIETRVGARLVLSPNSDETVAHGVHVDEIEVPERMRKRGAANYAVTALCNLADRYQFRLEGGPVGWSEHPWRGKFVAWVRRFGFVRDPRFAGVPIDDPNAFYIYRLPQPRRSTRFRRRSESTPRFSSHS